MDQKGLKFDLINNEIQNFQRQNQNQKQNQPVGQNSTCVEECSAKILVEKLIRIVENEGIEDSTFPVPQFSIEKPSPEQKACSNSLVVRELLSYSDARSLLLLRQVSRLWKEEATCLLLSSTPKPEELFCVRFEFWYHRAEWCNDNTYSLSDFIQTFAYGNFEIFQFSRLIFTGGLLKIPTLVQFFTDFGHNVQHLRLFPEGLSAIRNIVFKWTPNLKSLSLKQDLLYAEETERQFRSELFEFPLLPNLRKLILEKIDSGHRPPENFVLQKILTSAPNLTSIEDPSLTYISQIISAGKISLVKSHAVPLNCDFSEGVYDQNLLSFANAGGQLVSFHLEPEQAVRNQRILSAIRTLLQQSANTLENLKGIEKLGTILGPSSQIQIQLLPLLKVTKLHLTARRPTTELILPPGNALSGVFPNLKWMHIEVNGNQEDYPWISPLNAHSGLKGLKLTPYEGTSGYIFSQMLLTWLARLYPNVTHLHVDVHKMADTTIVRDLTMIPRNFEELQEITLEFLVPKKTSAGFKRWMDQALTGFSWTTCETLWSQREPNQECQKLEILEEIRESKSIFDLKKLTNLNFVVYFETRPQPIWTHLAEFYAFQPMAKRQGLEVNVRGYRSERVLLSGFDLRPIKPIFTC